MKETGRCKRTFKRSAQGCQEVLIQLFQVLIQLFIQVCAEFIFIFLHLSKQAVNLLIWCLGLNHFNLSSFAFKLKASI